MPKPNRLEDIFRFIKKNPGDSCWDWVGDVARGGYGRMGFGGKKIRASRASYVFHYGEIPEGMCVLHKCDNPPCTNPDHLFLGTIGDNNKDKALKGRHHKSAATHCHRGHELPPKIGNTRKKCRPCSIINAMEYRNRKKALATNAT